MVGLRLLFFSYPVAGVMFDDAALSRGLVHFQYTRDAREKVKLGGESFRKEQDSLEMLAKFILAYTVPGETVADLTCGAGSVAVAAYLLGRNAFISDTDPKFKEAHAELQKKGTRLEFSAADENVPTPIRQAWILEQLFLAGVPKGKGWLSIVIFSRLSSKGSNLF